MNSTHDGVHDDLQGIESGAIWDDVVATIAQMREFVYNDPKVDTPLLKAVGVRYLTQILAQSMVSELEDPAYPRFIRPASAALDVGGGNPDCLYHLVRLHSDYSYRISGKRGTTPIFGIEISTGSVAHCMEAKRTNCDFYVLGPHHADIEIFIGGAKREGNWVGLDPGFSYVLVRQPFNDWENEVPATLHIERIGAEYPPPPVSVAGAADYLRRFNEYNIEFGKVCLKLVEQFYKADPAQLRADHGVGWTQFNYGKTHWRCAPDEAVIMEVMPPSKSESPYWTFHLCNHFWQAMDFHFRQTSVNQHQAVLEADGSLRLVISHRDPGVPNWLDPAGHTFGLLFMRCFGYEMPDAKIRIVPFDNLKQELPSGTRTITKNERSEALRKRRMTLERRLLD